MDKDRIISVLKDQNFWGREQQVGLPRRELLARMRTLSRLKEALAIVGVRRAGKSTLAKQLMAEAIHQGLRKEETLYVNLEEPPFSSSLNLELLDEIYSAYREIISEKNGLIVLDEIQNIPAWEKWVRSRLERDSSAQIILTGSSSKLLSSEFSTVLSGRKVTLEVFPFSFRELADFRGLSPQNKKEIIVNRGKLLRLLREYLEFGGFPRVVAELPENKNILLKEYFDSILLRDIAARYKIKEVNILKALATIILTYNASLVSIARLTAIIQESFKLKVSLETISRFMAYLESAYLVFFVPIFSYRIKEQMKYPRKVYCVDTGLRNAVSFRFLEDLGKLAENVVFLELKRRGKDIFYWKSPRDKEIDFVIKQGLKVERLINVCWDISSQETRAREINSLGEGLAEFGLQEGLVITEDYEAEEEIKGKKIKYVPLWKWLLTS